MIGTTYLSLLFFFSFKWMDHLDLIEILSQFLLKICAHSSMEKVEPLVKE